MHLHPYYIFENIILFWLLCFIYDIETLNNDVKVFQRVLRNQCFNFLLICLEIEEQTNFNFGFTAFKFLIALAVEEILFYSFHRLLHEPKIYKILGHYVHHKWVITRPISTCDASVPDYLLTVLLPPTAGVLLTAMNLYEMRLWFFLVTWQGMRGHLGKYSYEHSIHHKKRNCNYGSGQRMDRLFGTFKAR